MNIQVSPLTMPEGYAPVVVVLETICYDLLEELAGPQSIQDYKLK